MLEFNPAHAGEFWDFTVAADDTLLQQAWESAEQARVDFESARQSLAGTDPTEADLAALDASHQAWRDAVAQARAASDAFAASVLNPYVEATEAEIIAFLRLNRTNASLPVAFRVVAWSESEIKRLGIALKAEARADRRGTQLHPDHTSVLSTARQTFAVSQAASEISARSDGIRAVFSARNAP